MNEDHFFSEILNLKAKIESEIAMNYCPIKKEVGDRVIVWDSSYSEDLENKVHYYGMQLDNHECIVTDINQDYRTTTELNNVFILDLIVYSPKLDRKIRTMSDCVKMAK